MKISVLEPLAVAPAVLHRYATPLTDSGHEVAYHDCVESDPEGIRGAGADADVIVVSKLPLPTALIDSLPALKMISVAFTGVDHIGMDACRRRGIAVSNAQGYATGAVVELVFGLVFALLRKIVPADAGTRAGDSSQPYFGLELSGRTFGVVGAGSIGVEVAKVARAFGCTLLCADARERPELAELGIRQVSLDDLMQQSDVVSLHVPLLDATRNLIDAPRLALMKPTAYLINTARGPVVDQEALTAALADGRIAGAGIDVFDTEPPLDPGHPLLAFPERTVVTPHVGFATQEGFIKRAEMVFENITAWIDGKAVRVVE